MSCLGLAFEDARQ